MMPSCRNVRRVIHFWRQQKRPYTIKDHHYGCIKSPVSYRQSANTLDSTIKYTVTDSPLTSDIRMENRCNKPCLGWERGERRIKLEIDQEGTLSVHAPWWLFNQQPTICILTPSITTFQKPMLASETQTS